jgi:hypothetical protein
MTLDRPCSSARPALRYQPRARNLQPTIVSVTSRWLKLEDHSLCIAVCTNNGMERCAAQRTACRHFL